MMNDDETKSQNSAHSIMELPIPSPSLFPSRPFSRPFLQKTFPTTLNKTHF